MVMVERGNKFVYIYIIYDVLHVICKYIYYKTCNVVKHQNDNKYNDAFSKFLKSPGLKRSVLREE